MHLPVLFIVLAFFTAFNLAEKSTAEELAAKFSKVIRIPSVALRKRAYLTIQQFLSVRVGGRSPYHREAGWLGLQSKAGSRGVQRPSRNEVSRRKRRW